MAARPSVTIPQASGSSWKVPANYELKKAIGSGAYGSVAEAWDTEKERPLAIKRCKRLFEDLIDCKRILRELAILNKLRHKNVVEIFDIVAPDSLATFNEVYFCMECCDTDFKKLIKQDLQLEGVMIHVLTYNLLKGLKYIHSAGIYHRDLKPANCLTNRDCCVKICDFGLARAVIEPPVALSSTPREAVEPDENGEVPVVAATQRLKRHLTQHVVTRWYRAPELILLQESYTEAIDMWSVGCIFAELLQLLPDGISCDERSPLFPGATSFPLSPDRKHKHDYRFHSRSGSDQLNKIFDLIGSPQASDINEITRSDAKRYVETFEARPGVGLSTRFPYADEMSLDLLGKMLVFNPKARISVQAALEHELLSAVRTPEEETTSTEVVMLEFDKERDLDEPSLRRLYGVEIRRYHADVSD